MADSKPKSRWGSWLVLAVLVGLLGLAIAVLYVGWQPGADDVGSGVLDVPVELDARRLQHPARRLGQLGAGAVAGDQSHFVCHGRGAYPSCLRARSL